MGRRKIWSLGSGLIVVAGCPVLEDALGALFGPPAPRVAVLASERIDLELVPREHAEHAGWTLRVNGVSTLLVRTARELAPMLEGLLVSWAVRTRENSLALHAAAAEVGDGTVLLVGDPGSGKSSLCLVLSRAGARYLGDEVAFIRLDNGAIEAFPKAITLKRGSFHLIPECESYPDSTRGPIRYFKPPYAAAIGEAKSRVELIVFPRFNPDCGATRSDWIGPETTALRLVTQCFGGVGRVPGTLLALAQLSERGAYAMEFSDGSQARARIQQLLEGE